MLNICISGLGAVGGYYGAMLCKWAQESGEANIYFIARGENLKVINEQGLHIITPTREFTVHPTAASDHPNELPVMDMIILTTKSYDLKDNIKQLQPLLKDSTILLPLQNGADIAEQVKELLPDNEVWMGCTYISSRRNEPGIITLEADRELLYMGKDGFHKTHKEQIYNKIFEKAGINVFNPEDVSMYIRKKYMMISATATATSYYNTTVGEVISQHPTEMHKLLEEVYDLFVRMGLKMPSDSIESAYRKQTLMPAHSTSSMHTDFQNGNKTELENLTGYVVHTAKEIGIKVPVYEMMYEKLKQS